MTKQDSKWIEQKKEMIDWIDNASLISLLRRWRFAPSSDPIFVGEVGSHFSDKLFGFRARNPDEWVTASKFVGWKV
jgi:hypothetical protein